MSVIPLPERPKSDPARVLLDVLQNVYANMPVDDQKQCAEVYLAMITEGVKAAREGGQEQ